MTQTLLTSNMMRWSVFVQAELRASVFLALEEHESEKVGTFLVT